MPVPSPPSATAAAACLGLPLPFICQACPPTPFPPMASWEAREDIP